MVGNHIQIFDAELTAVLKGLRDSKRVFAAYRQGVRKAMGQTFVPALKAIKYKHPTGRLRTAAGQLNERKLRRGQFGVAGFRSHNPWKGHHGRFIEYGTADRYTESGAYRGQAPRLQNVKAVFDANKDRFRDLALRYGRRELTRFIQRVKGAAASGRF